MNFPAVVGVPYMLGGCDIQAPTAFTDSLLTIAIKQHKLIPRHGFPSKRQGLTRRAPRCPEAIKCKHGVVLQIRSSQKCVIMLIQAEISKKNKTTVLHNRGPSALINHRYSNVTGSGSRIKIVTSDWERGARAAGSIIGVKLLPRLRNSDCGGAGLSRSWLTAPAGFIPLFLFYFLFLFFFSTEQEQSLKGQYTKDSKIKQKCQGVCL